MADKKLIEYIKKEFGKGFSQKKISDALKKSGYSDAEISEGFKYINEKAQNNSSRYLRFIIAGIAILLLIIFVVFLQNWFEQQDEKNIKNMDQNYEKIIPEGPQDISESPISDEAKKGHRDIFDTPYLDFSIPINDREVMELLYSEEHGENFMSNLLACDAVVKDDVLLCNKLESKERRDLCEARHKKFVVSKKLADNDCDFFSEPQMGIDKQFCEQFNMFSCSGLSGDIKKLCSSLRLQDPSMCIGTVFQGQKLDEKTCVETISLINAFKSKKELSCEMDYYAVSKQDSCKGIIKNDCTEILQQYAFFMVALAHAKFEKNIEWCENIQHKRLKDLCKNSLQYDKVLSMLD